MPVARWGKAERGGTRFHRLAFHGLDVAAVLAAGLARRPSLLAVLAGALGLPLERARSVLLLLAALHDLGKVGRAFQALRRDVCHRLDLDLAHAGRYRRDLGHDHLGQAMLCRLLRERRLRLPTEPPHASPYELATLLATFTGHHGVQPAHGFDLARFQGQYMPSDLTAAETLATALQAMFPWPVGLPSAKGLARVSYLLNGIASIVDWLGSHAAFGFHEEPMPLPMYWREHAIPTAERLLDEIRPWPFHPVAPRAPTAFRCLFPTLGGAAPTPLQAAVDRLFTAERLPAGPLLVLIEDVTGSGKTEAADLACQRLVALERAEGIYVGLPTMATADAAFLRREEGGLVERIYAAPADLMLAHSRRHRRLAVVKTRAELEQGDSACLDWFARSSKRALLTDVGIGTVDQVLAGALRAAHAPVRLAGMWRKVLVIDEVHAYDDYMRDVLAALLRHQGSLGQHVVLMSATLPSSMRDELVAAFAAGASWQGGLPALARDRYPTLTVAHAGGIEQPELPERQGPYVRVEPVHGEAALEERVLAWAAAGRSVVWFRNTVDEAVRSVERLAKEASRAGLRPPLLYHARFLPADRGAIEAELLRVAGKAAAPADRRSRIVIATQAAEQSLDLDFDELASDLAPADALIQRFGRRRRHPRDQDGARAVDGIDRRPESPALLHLPDPSVVDADWYARFSPGAARIYPDHGRLWLAQRYLLDPAAIPGRPGPAPGLDLGRDAKPLIEAVYAEDDRVRGIIPPSLRARLDAAAGEACQARQAARLNQLPFAAGLLGDWHRAEVAVLGDDALPMTRLGESFEVLLAVDDIGALRFLAETGDPLEESACRCPCWLGGLDGEDARRKALAMQLDDRGRRRLARHEVVLLASDGEGGWKGVGRALDQGKAIEILYDAKKGLRLVR
jgi:CRISPR-associated endonuclease/helicase Cas3